MQVDITMGQGLPPQLLCSPTGEVYLEIRATQSTRTTRHAACPFPSPQRIKNPLDSSSSCIGNQRGKQSSSRLGLCFKGGKRTLSLSKAWKRCSELQHKEDLSPYLELQQMFCWRYLKLLVSAATTLFAISLPSPLIMVSAIRHPCQKMPHIAPLLRERW